MYGLADTLKTHAKDGGKQHLKAFKRWGGYKFIMSSLKEIKEYYEVDISVLLEGFDVTPEQMMSVLSKAQELQKTSGLSQLIFNMLLGLCYGEAGDSFMELAEKMCPRWEKSNLKTLEDAVKQSLEDTDFFKIAKELYIGKVTNLLHKTL